MPTNIENIRSYVFHHQDKVFLDTNVWMSIYGPIAHMDERSKIYSGILKEIKQNRSKIFVDVVIISEFINTFARMEFKRLCPNKKPEEFKDFRRSSIFKPVSDEIAIIINNILNSASRLDTKFVDLDINATLNTFKAGNHDFNDMLIADTCRKNKLILITNDFDFRDENIRILTANRQLYN